MLELLAQGVYAWLQTPPRHGAANAGVVIDPDGITVIDTLMVPSQSAPLAAAVAELGLPVRRVVLSTSHIEFVGGTPSFPAAAVYGTRETSALLDQPPRPDVFRKLLPEFAAELDDELTTRPVTHVVDTAAPFTPATVAVPIDGEAHENLVVLVPEAGVLFAGAICSFGVTPLAFGGDPAGWADSLDEVAELAPVIVPGHGPIGGQEEVRAQQGYLRACVAAAGDPGALVPGPWDAWPGREWDAVNVERAALLARGEDRIPSSLLRKVGLA
ncbi:N/A [soil metagenome]